MKTLIVGCGNILAGDDGAGIWAVRELQGEALPRGAEIMEAGTPGYSLVEYLIGYDEVYIIDVMLGEVPGRLKVFPWHELPGLEAPAWHIHGAGLKQGLIAASRCLGPLFPAKIKIIAIEILPPAAWQEGLTTPVWEAVDKAKKLIREELSGA